LATAERSEAQGTIPKLDLRQEACL